MKRKNVEIALFDSCVEIYRDCGNGIGHFIKLKKKELLWVIKVLAHYLGDKKVEVDVNDRRRK